MGWLVDSGDPLKFFSGVENEAQPWRMSKGKARVGFLSHTGTQRLHVSPQFIRCR